MATQYTKDRENKLIFKGYTVAGINLSYEQIENIRALHFATEMKYTTDERGVPEYKVWIRPKGRLVSPRILYNETEMKSQELYDVGWNKERSKVACERNFEEDKNYYMVKTENGYVWREI